MRQKTRMSLRKPRREEKADAVGQDPAEWLLINEAGWGMPHYGCAVLAGTVVVLKAVGYYLGRRAASRSRRDDPPA